MSASVVANSCRLTIISSTLRVDLAVPVADLGRRAADDRRVQPRPGDRRPAARPRVAGCCSARPRPRSTRRPAWRPTSCATATCCTCAPARPTCPRSRSTTSWTPSSTGVLTRTSRWTADLTMQVAAAFAGALLVYTLGVLLLTGPEWIPSTIASGVVAVLLLLTSAAVARVYHRRGAGARRRRFRRRLRGGRRADRAGRRTTSCSTSAPRRRWSASAPPPWLSLILLAVVGAGFAGFVAVVTVALLTAIGTDRRHRHHAVGPGHRLDHRGRRAGGLAVPADPVVPAVPAAAADDPAGRAPTCVATPARSTRNQILGQAVRADQFLTGLVGGVALAIAGAAVLICAPASASASSPSCSA